MCPMASDLYATTFIFHLNKEYCIYTIRNKKGNKSVLRCLMFLSISLASIALPWLSMQRLI
ncbi:hypothetical protein U0070_019196 [Myodes glareolus]|uniref:Uncharacterized protein n=1 Tax=Myodes glareolus TaxID=447135 RepID=A0AAW0H4H3_MYOGA